MQHDVVAVTLNPSIDKTISIRQFQLYELNRVNNERTDPGGKGINVAKVLKNFGIDVLVTGFIGGRQGRYLLEFLRNGGIENHFIEVDGETRTNIKIIDESINKTTEVNEAGFFVNNDYIDAFMNHLNKLLDSASILTLGGSVPPGVSDSIYAQCIELARQKGVKTILDADKSALAKGIKAKPYAIKPNIRELEDLTGYRISFMSEIVKAGYWLLDHGIELVIVSMGPDGAVVMDKNEAYKVDTFSTDVKSTVGAGDSMVGALAYAIINKKPLREIAALTTAAGTVTVSKAGTQLCTIGEVLEAAPKVKCQLL